jgi:UDP-N-acetylglucosamine/UDP-N-acetyl-alpha-D-glucosaminouronate 4-epimerase
VPVSTVLVTGGAGFIGSHLVDRLLRDGRTVRVLDSFATGRRENLAHLEDVEIVEGDIQSYERVHTAVRGCDCVLHQAALPSVPRSVQDPLMTNVVNVTGTLNVLLAARDSGVRRVVYASSSSVYGPGVELPKREDAPPQPVSPYAVSKLAGESYCRAFAAVYGLESIALRYFNVFGPRQDPTSQYSAVIPRFITAARSGRAVTVYGDGSQSRDFTFIDNVVHANLCALNAARAEGQALNIACGERISLLAVIGVLGDLLQQDIEVDHAPPRAGEIPHSLADVSRAASEIGYVPAIGFRDGLARTIESFAATSAAAAAR